MTSIPARELSLGHALGAHLGGQLLLPGDPGHPPRFLDAPGQGLLAIDVLAQVHRRQADRSVHVVGNAHDHRVDLPVHRVEQLAVVAEPLGLGELLEGLGSALVVHVAEGHDVLGRDLLEVLGPLATAADDRQVQPVVRDCSLEREMRIASRPRPASPAAPRPPSTSRRLHWRLIRPAPLLALR